VSTYLVATMHRMPYLHRAFSAKEPYSSWLFCGHANEAGLHTIQRSRIRTHGISLISSFSKFFKYRPSHVGHILMLYIHDICIQHNTHVHLYGPYSKAFIQIWKCVFFHVVCTCFLMYCNNSQGTSQQPGG